MMTWMKEREQKWDTRHEDDKLWWARITTSIAKALKKEEPGQEVREKETANTSGMDGGGLEALQHADRMQDEGPEKRQHLQQQPKCRQELKLQLQPQHERRPKSPPTSASWWETVPPRSKSQKMTAGPGPVPMAGSSMVERRLIVVLATVPDSHFWCGSGCTLTFCQIGGPGPQFTQTVNSATVGWYTPNLSELG